MSGGGPGLPERLRSARQSPLCGAYDFLHGGWAVSKAIERRLERLERAIQGGRRQWRRAARPSVIGHYCLRRPVAIQNRTLMIGCRRKFHSPVPEVGRGADVGEFVRWTQTTEEGRRAWRYVASVNILTGRRSTRP